MTLVQQYEARLFPNSKKKDAAREQTEAWEVVHDELLETFPDRGIKLARCKTKWSNLKQEAKREFQSLNRRVLNNFSGVSSSLF